jgi:hypothetical protein
MPKRVIEQRQKIIYLKAVNSKLIENFNSSCSKKTHLKAPDNL